MLRELALQMLCKLPHIKAFMLGGRDAHQNGMPARKHWATNLVATTHTHPHAHETVDNDANANGIIISREILRAGSSDV